MMAQIDKLGRDLVTYRLCISNYQIELLVAVLPRLFYQHFLPFRWRRRTVYHHPLLRES